MSAQEKTGKKYNVIISKLFQIVIGLDEEQQRKVFKAYKKLYRNNKPLLENAKALAEQDGLDENVKAVLDVIIKSSQHRFGRYLETLRH